MDFGLLIPSMQDWQFALSQFFQTGGWVLYPILLVAMLMALLIIERSLFRFFHYPGYKQTTLNAVQSQQKPETQLSILCDLDLALKNQLAMIKTLIAICPLIGLLGTITGMVQVFDSLALYGTGNPRLMAAGVASAIRPAVRMYRYFIGPPFEGMRHVRIPKAWPSGSENRVNGPAVPALFCVAANQGLPFAA